MRSDELRQRFQSKAIEPETLFLLSSRDAIAYLDDAISCGMRLEGIEGFLITSGGAYQPQQGYSNDIADARGMQYDDFVAATRELIAHGEANGIWFDVVVTAQD